MLRKLVELVHRNLNVLPTNDAVATNVSPLSFVVGVGVPDYRNLCMDHGVYAETFEDNGHRTNSNDPRSTPAICIGCT